MIKIFDLKQNIDWFKPRNAQDITRQYGEDCYNLGVKHTLDHIDIFISTSKYCDNEKKSDIERLDYIIRRIKELRNNKD